MTQIDKEACREAYNQVRDDSTDVTWAVFKYEGTMIVPAGQGSDYEDFKRLCTGDGSGFSRSCRGGGERGLGKGTGRTRVTAAPSCAPSWAGYALAFKTDLQMLSHDLQPAQNRLQPKPATARAVQTLCTVSREWERRGSDGRDDARLFGFVRITMGDAMSKRAKFTLITWIGESISGLQRAKISTDKAMVKEVVQNFAKEFMFSDPRELDEDNIRTELKKAGGANYDAQTE
ncbi:Coactosin-like protein [Takifugu flavidus]|uniref:Coactosin-like protein n=1 Tax=Takifugu flavidus TaxID=433684 RepID=A0A5C6PDI2_9TELE|nr:Coactosin-like protein [Takifugu flavidus]